MQITIEKKAVLVSRRCIKVQEETFLLVPQIQRNVKMKSSSILSCPITNVTELLFSGHQKELYGFGNKAL